MIGRRWRVPLSAAALLTVAACSLPPAQPFGPPSAAPTTTAASASAAPISAPTTPAPGPTYALPTAPVARGPAGVGTRGADVTWLEQRLVALHYSPGTVDGVFDASTAAALEKFQACQALPVHGTLDTATRQSLIAPKPCRAVAPKARRTVAPKKPAPAPRKAVTPPPVSTRPTRGRVVYLTFDDGPDPTWTPKVLALLARHHARATFFVIGENAAAHPSLVRRERAAGNAVGNHTWDHPDLTRDSRTELAGEVDRTNRVIAAAGGGDARCLRPPYGARDAAVDAEARAKGMREELWTVDPRDWSRPGTSRIVERVLAGVHPGSVVLMHDGGGRRDQSVAALGSILTALRQRGYTFATLPC